MIPLILTACRPHDAPAELVDRWWNTYDYLPYVSSPCCGYIASGGDAALRDDDTWYDFRWHSDEGDVVITWSGFAVARLSLVDDELTAELHDGSSWTSIITEGCPL